MRTPREPPHAAFFLIGPTAVGKTAVAQRIAEDRGFEILSADSMLVYRGMDVGTAKPTPGERRKVRYWGLDLVPAGSPFNVALFLDEARRCFESAQANRSQVLVVGGTGLYVKALVEGLVEIPAEERAERMRRRAALEALGVEGLQRELRNRNPAWYASLQDPSNSRRLIRALELIEAGQDQPPQGWKSSQGEAEMVGMTMAREPLRARIALRVQAMFEQGLLDETRRLLADGFLASPTASQAIGYAEAAACIEGRLPREAAFERIVQRTHQLAKRQMTWFRHQAAVRWVEVTPTEPADAVAERVETLWKETGATPVAI